MGRLPPSLNISPTADLIPSKLWDYTPAYYISMIAEFQMKQMRIAKVDFWASPWGGSPWGGMGRLPPLLNISAMADAIAPKLWGYTPTHDTSLLYQF